MFQPGCSFGLLPSLDLGNGIQAKNPENVPWRIQGRGTWGSGHLGELQVLHISTQLLQFPWAQMINGFYYRGSPSQALGRAEEKRYIWVPAVSPMGIMLASPCCLHTINLSAFLSCWPLTLYSPTSQEINTCSVWCPADRPSFGTTADSVRTESISLLPLFTT